MGATLPAAAHHLESQTHKSAKIGLLYTFNILGAVVGCLGSGFVLLQFGDVWSASLVAAGMNATIALIAWLIPSKPIQTDIQPARNRQGLRTAHFRRMMWVVALSGLTALGAQILWTRLLSLLFAPTFYTFSVILAVFLIGLAIGSGLGSLLARRSHDPLIWLRIMQASLAFSMALCFYLTIKQIPFWPHAFQGLQTSK